jgi:spermidine synthase
MDEEDQLPNLWLHDTINPDFVQMHRIRDVLYTGKTQFQSVAIVESCHFGTCLILDGKLQSSEKDEFIYHEALVHPAMVSHDSPAAVFIAGGGEGATLREVLVHRSVERAVMVDIDEEAVDICRRFLNPWHLNSFDDPRVQLVFTDARQYLAGRQEAFDVIIIDLTDPVEEGPSCLLYTREFYEVVKNSLTPGGVLSLQAGSCSYGEAGTYSAVVNTVRSVFGHVCPYQCHIPSFGGTWGFALASEKTNPSLSADDVDRRISSRLPKGTRFYDGTTHLGMFALPRYLRQEMSQTKRIITDQSPLSVK